MLFLRNTRDPTLAQTGSENGMEKDTVASLNFSVHGARLHGARESAFLINVVHPVTRMPEFPARHIPCILRVRSTATKNLLASFVVEFSIHLTVTIFLFSFQTFLHFARTHLRFFLFPFREKIKFFTN